jgi:Flp pilus assembly pilin Flp
MPSLRQDARGASLVEYLLIVGLVALVLVVGASQLSAIDAKAEAQAACVTALACPDGSVLGSSGAPAVAATPQASTGGEPAPSPAPPPSKSKGWGESALDVGKGVVVDGLWGTVTGVWTMVTHPIQTAKGIGHAVAHPIQTGTAIKDGVVAAWEENPERLIGGGIFEVITLPVAALKATKASKLTVLTKATKTLDKVDDVADAAKVVAKADDVADVTKVEKAAVAAARTTDKFTLSQEEFIRLAEKGGLTPEKMTVHRFDSRPPDVIAKEGGLFPNPTKPPATSVEQHFEFGSTGSSTFVSTTVQEGNKAFVLGSDAPKTMVGLTDEQFVKLLETKLPDPTAPLPAPVEYVIYEYRANTLAAKTNAKVHVHEQEALTRGISASDGLEVREVRVTRPWERLDADSWEPGDTVSIQPVLPKKATVSFGDWTTVTRNP